MLAARNAVAVVFALNGVAVGRWFARVPAARDALGLEPDRLGILLLALSAGAVLTLLIVPQVLLPAIALTPATRAPRPSR